MMRVRRVSAHINVSVGHCSSKCALQLAPSCQPVICWVSKLRMRAHQAER